MWKKVPLLLLVWLAAVPALAQAAIAGSVTDPSDTPMPGVLVEASSPALIEKTRVATGDVFTAPDRA